MRSAGLVSVVFRFYRIAFLTRVIHFLLLYSKFDGTPLSFSPSVRRQRDIVFMSNIRATSPATTFLCVFGPEP
jgi:hypothetical protein